MVIKWRLDTLSDVVMCHEWMDPPHQSGKSPSDGHRRRRDATAEWRWRWLCRARCPSQRMSAVIEEVRSGHSCWSITITYNPVVVFFFFFLTRQGDWLRAVTITNQYISACFSYGSGASSFHLFQQLSSSNEDGDDQGKKYDETLEGEMENETFQTDPISVWFFLFHQMNERRWSVYVIK